MTSYSYSYSSESSRDAANLGLTSAGSGLVSQQSFLVSGGSAGVNASSTNQIASDLIATGLAGGLSVGYGSSASAGGAVGLSYGGSAAGGAVGLSYGGSAAGGAVGLSYGGSAAGGAVGLSYGGSAAGGAVGLSYGGSAAGGLSIGGSSSVFLSEVEAAILRSTVPIEINESEEITVIGQRGIWANKAEVVGWRGVLPITEYLINEDSNPEIINKKVSQSIEYIQELAIRYLRPPTPPAPGEIIITQEANISTPPAPPLIIRQQPARPPTPEPLVIREAPPQPPAQVGRKMITISGRRIPPPPRKVVIERLPPLPSKPQSVLIERWLPYAQVKRRVVFQGNNVADPVVVKPRNVIVQWAAPDVQIKKEIKYLGVINANPAEYVSRYGATLKAARDLPQYVLDIKTPDNLVLAANYQYNSIYELEGEIKALGLIDLDREGLSEYRAQLVRLGITFNGASSSVSFGGASSGGSFGGASSGGSFGGASSGGSFAIIGGGGSSSSAASSILNQMFASIDTDASGYISVSEAEKILLRLNSRLGRSYGEDDVANFFRSLDRNNDGKINLQEFRGAFERILIIN